MSELSINHLLGIRGMCRNDIETIFSTASEFKEVLNRPIKKVPSLRDITRTIDELVIRSKFFGSKRCNVHKRNIAQP